MASCLLMNVNFQSGGLVLDLSPFPLLPELRSLLFRHMLLCSQECGRLSIYHLPGWLSELNSSPQVQLGKSPL